MAPAPFVPRSLGGSCFMHFASASLFWNTKVVAILARPWALLFAPVVGLHLVQGEHLDERAWGLLANPFLVPAMILFHILVELIRSLFLPRRFTVRISRRRVAGAGVARRDVSLLTVDHQNRDVEV